MKLLTAPTAANHVPAIVGARALLTVLSAAGAFEARTDDGVVNGSAENADVRIGGYGDEEALQCLDVPARVHAHQHADETALLAVADPRRQIVGLMQGQVCIVERDDAVDLETEARFDENLNELARLLDLEVLLDDDLVQRIQVNEPLVLYVDNEQHHGLTVVGHPRQEDVAALLQLLARQPHLLVELYALGHAAQGANRHVHARLVFLAQNGEVAVDDLFVQESLAEVLADVDDDSLLFHFQLAF